MNQVEISLRVTTALNQLQPIDLENWLTPLTASQRAKLRQAAFLLQEIETELQREPDVIPLQKEVVLSLR